MIAEKRCSGCKETKPAEFFARNRSYKDGLHYNCRECHKIYYRKTRDYQIDYVKRWGRDNRERVRRRNKAYWQENKTRLMQENLKYTSRRRSEDHVFATVHNLRSRLSATLTQKRFSKASTFPTLLGCTPTQLKEHLEAQFEPWMSWDNRGKYNGLPQVGWDVDHIIPLSSAQSVKELELLVHYTNLRPLCSYVNRDLKKAKHQWK